MDENGRIIEDAAVKWAISDESVATVSDDGTVTAVRSGSVVVTATSGEVFGKRECNGDPSWLVIVPR